MGAHSGGVVRVCCEGSLRRYCSFPSSLRTWKILRGNSFPITLHIPDLKTINCKPFGGPPTLSGPWTLGFGAGGLGLGAWFLMLGAGFGFGLGLGGLGLILFAYALCITRMCHVLYLMQYLKMFILHWC